MNVRTVFLAMVVIITINSLVIPSIGGLQVSQGITYYGTIAYYNLRELGVWHTDSTNIPPEATWVVALAPNYVKPRENISVILNWYDLHPPDTNNWRIMTASELQAIEDGLKSVQTANFWGILFICEEHYRIHVAFNDDVNIVWFGERLMGYPLYLQGSPGATRDQWMDEMFLRMLRGFRNYFHGKGVKVGVTATALAIMDRYRGQNWGRLAYYFGQPAFNFVKDYYDFVILYCYTLNLEDFQWTKEYFKVIDNNFERLKKFWILTRPWSDTSDVWKKEAIGLEMKNCLDRNIAITTYQYAGTGLSQPYSIEEWWRLMKKSIQLYNEKAPYYEEYVYGQNLLTEHVGNTYGWVKV